MSEKIEINGGAGWINVRAIDDVTNRQRRPFARVLNRMRRGEKLEDSSDFQMEWATAITFMVVDQWSQSVELPDDYDAFMELFDNLPSSEFDAVTIAAIGYFGDATKLEPPDDDEEVEPEPPPPTKRPTKRSATP